MAPVQLNYRIDSLFGSGAQAILDLYPNNSLLFDVAFQFYPWSFFTLKSIRSWDIPLWNPYSMAGLPFLANHQSGIFEFTKLVAYPLGLDAVWLPTFSWWLTIMLAGSFTYAFLRQINLSFFASMVGGTVFALSGPMVVWLGWPHTSTAVWLPFLLLCTEKVIASGRPHWIGLLASALALTLYAGHIQVAFFVMFAVVLWGVFRMSTTAKDKDFRRPLLSLAVACILGLGLASIQLWPTMEFVSQSALSSKGRSFTGGIGIGEALGTGFWLRPHGFMGFRDALLNLGLFVYPDLFGDTDMAYLRRAGNYNENSVYGGLVALSLAVTGLFLTRKNRGPAMFWLLIAIVAMGGALAIPGLAILNYLPFFNAANMGRIRYLAVFALAVLAALGAEAVFRGPVDRNRRAALLVLLASLGILAAGVFGAIGFSAATGNEIPSPEMLARETRLLARILVGMVAVCTFAAVRNSRMNAAARIMLILLVAFELLSYGTPLHKGIDPALARPSTPAMLWLKKHVGSERVTSYRETPDNRTSLYPNSSVSLGLQDIRGYEVLQVNRFERLQKVVSGKDSRLNYRSFNSDFFNIAGVGYFVQSKNDPERTILRSKKFKVVYRDETTVVYRNRDALPRAFVAHRTRGVRTADTAIDWFRGQKADFRRAAIVENGPSLDGSPKLTPAKILKYSPESVDLEVSVREKGLLVLSDAYYEGWRAYLDGKETAIYPANVAFRGVVVPKGRHRIRFLYRPDSFHKALFIFYPSLLVVAGLLLTALKGRGRGKSPEPTPVLRSSG